MKSLLELNNIEAKEFFLKSESYFNVDLPPYFNFNTLLSKISSTIQEGNTFKHAKIKSSSTNNHTILANKDGQYSWRPFKVINPVIYIDIVNTITEKQHWGTVLALFKKRRFKKIDCVSIPLLSDTKLKDKSAQINQWWRNIELQSLELSLEYNCFFETDIANCYSSIYTHSISWAIDGKKIAKERIKLSSEQKKPYLLGEQIDHLIQTLQHGQTNGIPQGSVLMDFIAEILLSYIDDELNDSLTKQKIKHYKILRYRDDYRIFSNDENTAKTILKTLSSVLYDCGLSLNSSKTNKSSDMILSSVKNDKVAWLDNYLAWNEETDLSILKVAIALKNHSLKHPNSGSLLVALQSLYNKTPETHDKTSTHFNNIKISLISVIVNIAFCNPKTYPVCFAILSKVLNTCDTKYSIRIIKQIQKKFKKSNYIGYMEIWLQRIAKDIEGINYEEKLCSGSLKIWDVSWLENDKIRDIFESEKYSYLDRSSFDSASAIVQNNEFNLFSY